jgi:hypothetical protein
MPASLPTPPRSEAGGGDGKLPSRRRFTNRRRIVTSGYIPASEDPGPDEILAALREAIREDPDLRERGAEDVSRDLASRGYLEREPSPTLVAEMLGTLEREER